MKDTLLHIYSRIHSSLRPQSGPGLPASTAAAYNASRGRPHSRHICHAPFTNMYFNVHGDCAPCWLTFLDPDSYPQKSVRDIWFGEKFTALRTNLKACDLTDKCNVCLKNLQAGNYTSVLARAYDVNEPADYPAMMELELGNTCNLECVMCIGELSSSIRKNREQLPPLRSPYDEAFVQQLGEFIPHLKELRVNGGEPFLIGLVYKIFEQVERHNPRLKIVVATNGTVLNNKVRHWLDRLNIHINFSLDSLTPAIYESIRVNAKFSRVMEHFDFFHDYCKANGRTMCIMVNPMRNNWHEMPAFVRLANSRNVNLWFNTIHRPVEMALWPLPPQELWSIHRQLSAEVFTDPASDSGLGRYNLGIFKNLVDVQIRNWAKESEERSASEQEQLTGIDNRGAYDRLVKRISDHIYLTVNEGEEQKKLKIKRLVEKLEALNHRVEERNGKCDMYLLMVGAPGDELCSQLESRPLHELVNEMEQQVIGKSVT